MSPFSTVNRTMRFPEARPFHSLAELRDWVREDDDVFASCRIPLSPCRELKNKKCQQVLVCHDMAGGYLPGDRFLQGSSVNPIYTLKCWDLVDVFVYFSHARVASPPSTWTAAAHRNGVKVLGTLITEDPSGTAENQELIFGPGSLNSSNISFSRFYADKLVDLACQRGFDGWFLNLESSLPKTQIDHLIAFLDYLTLRMHAAKPDSLVIWYDSLTIEGKVEWQDALTPLNKPFFDVTDGIFTNYTWSKDAPAKSHALAKGRNFDVYTGTDVWGRNTYGGGGFNVHKAFRVVHDAETSVAIFAPAWTYEFLGTDSFEKVNDPRFWVECSSKPILPSITGTPPNLPSTFPDPADLGCVADFVEPRRLSGNCFRTNFCLGFGSSYWIQGKKVSSASWSHIGRQSLLSSSWLTKAPKSSVVLEYTTDLAFHGGSCLQLSLDLPKGAIDEGIQLVPIFDCEMCIVEDSFFQGSMQTTSFDKRIGCFVQTDDDVQCKWFKKGDMERNDWWTFSMEIKRGVTVRALGICISADPENEPFNDAEMVESSNCPVLSCFAIPQSNSRTNGIQSKMGDKIDSNVKEANVIKSVDISLPDPALPKSEHPKQRVYIGQMSLQPKRPEMSAPLEVLSHHITIRDVFREDGMAYWTLSWPSEPGFECWEVYRGDSVWIGTALTNAFRDSGPDVPQNGTSYHIYGYEY